jgi:Fe-S cluster biosynthesis and repair protein YggX
MTYEGSTSFVATEDDVTSCKTSARIIVRYGSHRRTLQSECPKCRQLDNVSCIQSLTCSCNIVQEVALTSTCNKIKSIVFFVLMRHYATKIGSKLYRSNFLGSNSSWAAWPLNIRLLGCLEKSVCNCNFRIRNILEEKIPQFLLRIGNLKWRWPQTFHLNFQLSAVYFCSFIY